MTAPTLGARYVVNDAGEPILDLDTGTLVTVERVDIEPDGRVFVSLAVPALDMLIAELGWEHASPGLRPYVDAARERTANERAAREIEVYDLLADRGVHGAMALATRIVAALFPAGEVES